jgi:hypothetical protein
LRRTGMLLEGWTVSPYGCGGSIHRITCTVLLQGRSVLIAICIEEMRRDHRRGVMERVKDSTATGKRLQWDSMKTSTAVGSNPWERWKGRGGRWSGMIMGSGSRVFKFFLAGLNPSPTMTNGCLVGGQR